jgi:hypothetical protein
MIAKADILDISLLSVMFIGVFGIIIGRDGMLVTIIIAIIAFYTNKTKKGGK